MIVWLSGKMSWGRRLLCVECVRKSASVKIECVVIRKCKEEAMCGRYSVLFVNN